MFADKPNNKFVPDPRVWLRKAEESMVERCGVSIEKLSAKDTYPAKVPEAGTAPIFNFKPANPVATAATQGMNAIKGAMHKVGL